jgi:cytochrome oxidase Cu insertion factor (SCO1/SenC/PrrC family)
MKKTGVLIAAAFLVVVLAVFATLILRRAELSKAELPVYGEVPEFTFTNQDGEPFGRAQMLGKVTVVDFIFTRCQSACPIMAREMSALYRAFEGTSDLQFVSISVDPGYDTLAVLKAYAAANGVTDARWQFLHTSVENVVDLSENGFMLAADRLPMGHSTKFALVDREGRIRGYYNALDDKPMAVIREQIKQLLKEPWNAPEVPAESAHSSSDGQQPLALK